MDGGRGTFSQRRVVSGRTRKVGVTRLEAAGFRHVSLSRRSLCAGRSAPKPKLKPLQPSARGARFAVGNCRRRGVPSRKSGAGVIETKHGGEEVGQVCVRAKRYVVGYSDKRRAVFNRSRKQGLLLGKTRCPVMAG